MRRIVLGALLGAATVLTLLSPALAAAPDGWFLAGSKPANYDTGIDPSAANGGLPSAYIKARADQEGFGTLMQSFNATKYLGKRIRFSANIRSGDVARWAGLWVRVDGPGTPPKSLAIDNMQQRPIKGTADWKRYEVVLDVSDAAVGISIGLLLDGPGEVWLNGAEFEIVSAAVPVTAPGVNTIPDSPRNLTFNR